MAEMLLLAKFLNQATVVWMRQGYDFYHTGYGIIIFGVVTNEAGSLHFQDHGEAVLGYCIFVLSLPMKAFL